MSGHFEPPTRQLLTQMTDEMHEAIKRLWQTGCEKIARVEINVTYHNGESHGWERDYKAPTGFKP